MHTTENGITYLLDGGASVVRMFDKDYNLLGQFSFVVDENDNNYYFDKAKGIFADTDGNIYIADTNHARVIKCDSSGRLIRLYNLPDSHLIPDGFNYQPIKVAVDHKGYVYILSNGSYYGAILYSPKDEFLGFYGSNDVPATIILPEPRVLSCKVNAVEMSLCISNSPSPMVQIRAFPSAVRWLRINR